MKRLMAAIAAFALVMPWQAPADAHIVYFKDGTAVRGTVVLKEAIVTVKGEGNTEMSFPLESVRAVSFSDEPIVYEQKSASATSADWLMWSAVAANLVAAVAAVLVVSASR